MTDNMLLYYYWAQHRSPNRSATFNRNQAPFMQALGSDSANTTYPTNRLPLQPRCTATFNRLGLFTQTTEPTTLPLAPSLKSV